MAVVGFGVQMTLNELRRIMPFRPLQFYNFCLFLFCLTATLVHVLMQIAMEKDINTAMRKGYFQQVRGLRV